MRKQIIIFLLLSVSVAQAQNDGCIASFKASIQKLKGMALTDGKGGISVQYKVLVRTVSDASFTDDISFNVQDKRVSIVSAEFSIYQDEKTIVVIQPKAKTIMLTKIGDKQFRTSQLQDFAKLQDSIFNLLELRNCVVDATAKWDGAESKRLDFNVPDPIGKNLGMKSVSYWINESQSLIRRVQIEYRERAGQQVKSVSFDFMRIDNSYNQKPFEGSALSKVMEDKGGLKQLYRGYAVIDKRK